MAVTGDTLAALRRDLHELEIKVVTGQARSEERHEAVLLAITKLSEDLSEQGKTPKGPPERTGFGSLVPATWTPMSVAQALLLLLPFLAGIWGVSYSGAQSGGAAAVTDAVEQGEAVPVSMPPTIRVVPLPRPVPVPAPPVAAPVEPPPVENPAHDLLPLHPEP